MVSVITMKGTWYYPTPIRLSVAALCASFLATYSSAADTSTAHHRSPASLTFSASDTGEIRKNLSILIDESTEQALFDSRAAQWQLLLVNADNPLPADYQPDLTDIGGGILFRTSAADSLRNMIADGQAAGYNLTVCSGYRSYERQRQLFYNQVALQISKGKPQEQAEADAAHVVAYPGTSEHASGLAADIVTQEYLAQYSSLTRGFENTGAFGWLIRHCTEYGFILRYPEDKTDITGIIYEPWHFRFVGQAAAEEMTRDGLCLEEYLGQVNSSSEN